MITKGPGEYDGKAIGVASSVRKLTAELPGPKRFSGLRRRLWNGDPNARRTAQFHILRLKRRGKSIHGIAGWMGIPRALVEELLAEARPRPAMTPRLVKKS